MHLRPMLGMHLWLNRMQLCLQLMHLLPEPTLLLLILMLMHALVL